jgi:hypothetical protein
MPISSKALGWPKSYWKSPVETENHGNKVTPTNGKTKNNNLRNGSDKKRKLKHVKGKPTLIVSITPYTTT